MATRFRSFTRELSAPEPSSRAFARHSSAEGLRPATATFTASLGLRSYARGGFLVRGARILSSLSLVLAPSASRSLIEITPHVRLLAGRPSATYKSRSVLAALRCVAILRLVRSGDPHQRIRVGHDTALVWGPEGHPQECICAPRGDGLRRPGRPTSKGCLRRVAEALAGRWRHPENPFARPLRGRPPPVGGVANGNRKVAVQSAVARLRLIRPTARFSLRGSTARGNSP